MPELVNGISLKYSKDFFDGRQGEEIPPKIDGNNNE
jgi:hypothetical protein